MIFVIIVLGVFLGDLMLKKYVEANLPEGEERTFLGGRIRIRKLHNRGIALGALSERPALIRMGLLIALAAALPKKGGNVRKTGLSLMLGGALCNWFDRFHQGAVTDYVSFGTRWKKFARLVFNLSDFCIFLGGILAVFGKGNRYAAERVPRYTGFFELIIFQHRSAVRAAGSLRGNRRAAVGTDFCGGCRFFRRLFPGQQRQAAEFVEGFYHHEDTKSDNDEIQHGGHKGADGKGGRIFPASQNDLPVLEADASGEN